MREAFIKNLSFDLDRKAFMVFSAWKNKAIKETNTRDIDNINEEKITDSFLNSIIEGLKIISEKPPEKRNLEDWCVGFLSGFISSHLSVEWSNRYLNKTPEYLNLLWQKSIILYLNADKLFQKRINRLYNYLLETDFPNELHNNPKEALNEVEMNTNRIIWDLSVDENWEMHKGLLEEELYDRTLKVLKNPKQIIEIDDLDNFLERKNFRELVYNNPFIH